MANLLSVPDAYTDQLATLLAIGRQKLPGVVIDSDTLIPSWSQVLAVGATSGVTSPVIDAGVPLQFAGPAITSMLSWFSSPAPTLQIVAGNNGTTGSHLQLSPGEGSISANNGVLNLTHGGATPYSAILISDSPSSPGHLGGAAISIDQNGLAFFDGTTVTQPSITGAKGGNAALTSLLTALANMGLIVDNTT